MHATLLAFFTASDTVLGAAGAAGAAAAEVVASWATFLAAAFFGPAGFLPPSAGKSSGAGTPGPFPAESGLVNDTSSRHT
jgi:hypothetical protein